MPPTQPPLSTILPPLICGTATFNNLYNADAALVPTNAIVERALDLGVRAFDTWSREGAGLGGVGGIGVSVMGVSNLQELEETIRVWNSVLDGLPLAGREVPKEKKEWSLARAETVAEKAKAVWTILGRWKNYTWASPDEGYVNVRAVKGVVDEIAPLPLVKDGSAKESRL